MTERSEGGNVVGAKVSFCRFLIALIFAVISPLLAGAVTLSPVAHLHRCYAHLTGKRMPSSHSLLAAVQAGTKTSNQACEDLMDRMLLKTNGMINDSDVEIALDAERALNYLNQQDNLKISARDFCLSLPDSGQYCDGQYDVFDANVPGLILTEALLNPQRQYRDIFSISRVPMALRQLAATTQWPQFSAWMFRVKMPTLGRSFYNDSGLVDALLFPDLKIQSGTTNVNVIDLALANNAYGFSNRLSQTSPLSSWAPPTGRIRIGSLKGIVYDSSNSLRFPTTASMDPFFKIGGQAIEAFDPRTTIDQRLSSTSSDPLKNGGGVFATREYLMLNFGWGYNFAADGVVNTPRRWSQAVLKDFLCRPLPVIRDSDAKPYVVSEPAYSAADVAGAAPFRFATNCASCHSVMDQFAGVLRDVTWMQPAFSNDNNAPGATIQIVRRPSSLVVATPDNTAWRTRVTTGTETVFWKRQPIGHLMFRSYDGRLRKIDANNLTEMAQRFADEDDPYVCAASRYFRQLTGHEVSLHDVGDPASASLNAGMTKMDWERRNYVISLGLRLKESGHASEIFKSILTSKYFKERQIVTTGDEP